MKQMFSHTRALRAAAVLGLTGMLAGIITAAPAHAQDDWHFHRWNDHGRYDRVMVTRDENRLRDLYAQRRDAQFHHDRRAVRRLDQRIADLRYRLDHDRYVARH